MTIMSGLGIFLLVTSTFQVRTNGETASTRDIVLDIIKGTLSCPQEEFFSFPLRTCKNCEAFCNSKVSEATCEAQCSAHFLEMDQKGKDQDYLATLSNLKKDIETNANKLRTDGASGNITWGFAISLAVVSFISNIITWVVLYKSKKQAHWHGPPQGDWCKVQYKKQQMVKSQENDLEAVGHTEGHPME